MPNDRVDRGEPIIRLEGVEKWFGKFQVLTDIDLRSAAGERIVVCGPSGSGKSTLIRCINGLETVQKGRIVVDGIDARRRQGNVDAVRARGRHGVPAVQPVPAPDRAAELHAGADARRAASTQGRGRGHRDEVPRPRAHPASRPTSIPASSPAASSSASRSRARCA